MKDELGLYYYPAPQHPEARMTARANAPTESVSTNFPRKLNDCMSPPRSASDRRTKEARRRVHVFARRKARTVPERSVTILLRFKPVADFRPRRTANRGRHAPPAGGGADAKKPRRRRSACRGSCLILTRHAVCTCA